MLAYVWTAAELQCMRALTESFEQVTDMFLNKVAIY